MDGLLKQSIAHTFQMGPFIDDTDGKTAETGLTIAYTDVFLSKHGGAFAAKADTTNLTGTGDTRGYYDCVLNTTDTGTLGTLKVCAHITGALPVWHTFQVVAALVWDSFFGADRLQVDVEEIGAGIITAGAIADAAIDFATFAADCKTGSGLKANVESITANAIAAAAINTGAITATKFAAGAIDAAAIADAAIDLATFAADVKTGSALKANVETITAGAITAAAIATNAIDADALAADAVDEIWDELVAGHTTSLTFGKYLGGAPTGASLAADIIDVHTDVGTAITNIGDMHATDLPAVKAVVDTISGHITADYTATEKSAIDLLDDAVGGLVDIHTDVADVHTDVGTAITNIGDVHATDLPDLHTDVAAIKTELDDIHTTDLPAVKTDTAAILADTGTDGVVLPQAQADKVWGTTVRALTDKADFALSSASRDAIWDQAGSLSLSFETLIQRLYQMVNNKMVVTESTGGVVLRSIGDGADIATGNVQDLGATTQRNELAWV
jgi:hypothetical protein